MILEMCHEELCSQGDYVVLASEPVCLCGVDVSAPNQIRREPGIPLQAVMSAFQDQMTMLEVMRQLFITVSWMKIAVWWIHHSYFHFNIVTLLG